MTIISQILDTASKTLGLDDTVVSKLLTAAVETLSGIASGDAMTIMNGAKKFAAAAGEAAGKVEYYEPPASTSGSVPSGYAPSSTASAAPTTSTAAATTWDAQFANALTVLRDRFDLLDTAAGHGRRDGIINRDDLAAALQNPALPADVRRACLFLLQNPAAWNRIDVGAGIGKVDGAIGRCDVSALLGAGAKPASGPNPRSGSSSAGASTPGSSTAGAASSASAANGQSAVSEWDRKYANAVKAFSDYFALIDRPTSLPGATLAPDGRITKNELQQAISNPDLPQALRDAIHFLCDNPAAFDCLDGANGRGRVDGTIFKSDIRCELERVGKNAGPAPASTGSSSTASTTGATATATGPTVSEWDRKYANAVKAFSDYFALIDRPTSLPGATLAPDGRITKNELQQAISNPDLPQALRDAIHFLLDNPAAFDCLDGANGRGRVDGKIFKSDIRCELERVGKNAGPAPVATPGATPGGIAPATTTVPLPATTASYAADVISPLDVNWGSTTSVGGSRFAGMSPEEIVNAILLGALDNLDSEMVDIAKQLEAAQNAQSGAERGSTAEKQATSDVNRLQFKLQQVAERRRQMFELVSNLANLSHEMARAAVSNIGRA